MKYKELIIKIIAKKFYLIKLRNNFYFVLMNQITANFPFKRELYFNRNFSI